VNVPYLTAGMAPPLKLLFNACQIYAKTVQYCNRDGTALYLNNVHLILMQVTFEMTLFVVEASQMCWRVCMPRYQITLKPL
jgi:hypothetical protein